MNQRNYQRELDELLRDIGGAGEKPKLFLHCCCAPCSSYVLEYLSAFFTITLLFYNPNITDDAEYEKRKQELVRLVKEGAYPGRIELAHAEYDSGLFFERVRGLEREPERGKRCFVCYEIRLRKTAELAAAAGADYFCTTLSISPHKSADKLMEIGETLGREYGVSYLPSDFKKRNGYKRSIELSRQYGLYRQNYCGCVFSKNEAKKRERCPGQEGNIEN